MLKLYTIDSVFIKSTNEFPENFTGMIEWPDGSKVWLENDKLHRFDGPAFINEPDGKRWYVNDEKVTELECKLLHDIMKLKGLL